jgi:hypothetical protein
VARRPLCRETRTRVCRCPRSHWARNRRSSRTALSATQRSRPALCSSTRDAGHPQLERRPTSATAFCVDKLRLGQDRCGLDRERSRRTRCHPALIRSVSRRAATVSKAATQVTCVGRASTTSLATLAPPTAGGCRWRMAAHRVALFLWGKRPRIRRAVRPHGPSEFISRCASLDPNSSWTFPLIGNVQKRSLNVVEVAPINLLQVRLLTS